MVNIKVIVEGGILPGDNIDANTFDNSEKFRESFHILLSHIFTPASFNLVIEPGASNNQAIKSFKKEQQKGSCILLIDSDSPKTQKAGKLEELTLTGYENSVFFMVQEMEAWILSQPECIIKTYSQTLVCAGNPENDEVFKLIPGEIPDPTRWLGIILSRYYRYEKNGIIKKKKYGKLKDGPLLLANLSMSKLIDVFEDVKRLSTYQKHTKLRN